MPDTLVRRIERVSPGRAGKILLAPRTPEAYGQGGSWRDDPARRRAAAWPGAAHGGRVEREGRDRAERREPGVRTAVGDRTADDAVDVRVGVRIWSGKRFMRHTLIIAIALLTRWMVPAGGQSSLLTTPHIPGVVAQGTTVRVVKEGLEGTEGPVPAPDGSVYFTSAGRILKLDRDDNISVLLQDAAASSILFDQKGRLIATQRGKVAVILPKGSEGVLTDTFGGQPYMAPNDLVIDRKGGVYFTDPGPILQPGQTRPRKPAVYYLRPDGKVIQITDGITRPNGVQLSPDERTLYVDDTFGDYVYAFDVQSDGSTRNQRPFVKLDALSKAEPGALALPSGLLVDPETGIRSGADGMAMDDGGRLYVCADTGVQVFGPRGDRLGILPVPKPPQNLAFAGPDRKTLYVVGRGSVFKIQMLAEGVRGRSK